MPKNVKLWYHAKTMPASYVAFDIKVSPSFEI